VRPTFMHCFDVQPDFEAYVGGERGPLRAVFLEQHLAGCDACRAGLARLQAVVDALETWPLAAEPAHLKARVKAQVRPRPALPRLLTTAVACVATFSTCSLTHCGRGPITLV